MLPTTLAVIISFLATLYMCKSINAHFDKKNQFIAEEEKELARELESLKQERREAKRELNKIKDEVKNFNSQQDNSTPVSDDPIENWLLNNNHIDQQKLEIAKEYANDKNMQLLSAMLTLNMISLDIYEKARGESLRTSKK